jgi:hypothetical protein
MTSLSTEMTNLLQFTINVRKSHRQPQCTLQLCVQIPPFFSNLIFTFRYADSSIQYTSVQFVSCIHHSSVNFALHPTPPKKQKSNRVRSWRFKQLYLGNHSEFDTCLNNFFSQQPTLSPPQNIDISPKSLSKGWSKNANTSFVKFA